MVGETESRLGHVKVLLQYLSYVANKDLNIASMSQLVIRYGWYGDLERRFFPLNREQPMRFAAMFGASVMYMFLGPRWGRTFADRITRSTAKIALSCSQNMHLSRNVFGCEQTEECKRQSVLVAKVGETDYQTHPEIRTSRSYSRPSDVSRNQYKAPASPPVSAMTDIKPYAG